MPMLEQEGIFKAEVIEKVVKQKEGSKAIRLSFKFQITHILNGKEWGDWSEYGMHTYGDICVVKGDGLISDKGVEQARDGLGWQGQIEPTAFDAWVPTACQINVKPEKYNGKTTFKVQWINAPDYEPTGMQGIDAGQVNTIAAQYGAQFRALCAAAKPQTPVPTSSAPKAPPPAPSAPPPPPAASALSYANRDEAWAAVIGHNEATHDTPHEIANVSTWWSNAIPKLFPGRGEDSLTSAEWGMVAKEVMDTIDIPF